MDLIGLREGEIREHLAADDLTPEQRAEARDFLERRGRFALMDASEPGREQVLPGLPPPDIEQTHSGRHYRDGS